MPHGQNVSGLEDSGPTVTQGALAVPFPGSPEKFYLFTMHHIYGNSSDPYTNMRCVLYCNVVDMTMNNGLGDIDTAFSLYGVPLADSLSEKMTVARGCNQNLWVIVHKKNGDVFYTFEVQASGINTNPVVSSLPGSPKGYLNGVLKMNPAEDRLMLCDVGSFGQAPAAQGAYLYNFDPVTGILFNRVPLDTVIGYYGAAFSPDGTKLYGQPAQTSYTIYQFDLNAANIPGSKIHITPGIPITLPAFNWADLKLGPDGKIYIASSTFNGPAGRKYISRINSPDNAGLACNFQDTIPGVNFFTTGNGSSQLGFGFPNDFLLPVNGGTEDYQLLIDTLLCRIPANGFSLQAPPGFSSYIWNDTSAGTPKSVTTWGTYWVRYRTSGCNWRTDTFRIKGGIMELAIVFSNNILSTTHTYTTYQWYKEGQAINGATGQYYQPAGNGWYSVKVTGPYGCTDSAAILVGASGIGTTEALKDHIHVYPNPANDKVHIESPVAINVSICSIDGRQLFYVKDFRTTDTKQWASGIYFVRIYDKNNQFIKTEKLAISHEE